MPTNLFNAYLMLSKSFQFFLLVLKGKHLSLEKVRDKCTRMITLRSALHSPWTMCMCKSSSQSLLSRSAPLLLDCQRTSSSPCVSDCMEWWWTISVKWFLRHVTYLPVMKSRSILDWQDQTLEKVSWICKLFHVFNFFFLIISIIGIIDIL